jgi:hypothetical protein
MRLGLRPADPSRPVLHASQFLTGRVPDHPAHVDHLIRDGLTFGLYGNDRFGVCGPASLANSRRLTTAWLTGHMTAPSQADVFDLYRRAGNPNFTPETGEDDNGVVLADMLSTALHTYIAGVKPVCYARVNTADHDEIRAATAIFGALVVGVDLQTAQQHQTQAGVWDWVPSGEWGGHAVLAGAYADEPGNAWDRLGVITWAETVECTTAFLARQLLEAWVVVWPEHLTDRGFLQGVDLGKLAAAYEELTGRPFPQVPAPGPSPRPEPDPVVPPDLGQAVRALVDDPLTRTFLISRYRGAAARAVQQHVKTIIEAASIGQHENEGP